MSAALQRVLRERTADGDTRRDGVARTLVEMATNGNLDAIRYVFDRIDGKIPDAMMLGGFDGGPIDIRELIVTLPVEDESTDDDHEDGD